MKTRDFLKRLDDGQIVAAIQSAESKTSGEIRLFVTESIVADPVEAAQQQFVRMGMTQTKARNGILLFFAPKSQAFAVIGDTGIHQKCGQTLWNSISGAMQQELKAGHYTEAVVRAIEKAGAELAAHFPPGPDNRNELPDDIVRG